MRHFLHFAAVFLTLTWVISAFTTPTATQQLTLIEALKSPLIDASVSSNGKYSGNSVQLHFVNKSNSPLSIIVPAGTMYSPEDNGEQTLIQLEEQFIVLKPGGTYNGQVAAFCTEASDRCPTTNTSMSVAQNTHPKFIKLLEYVKGKDITKTTFQDAVWAVSDNYAVSNILADKPTDVAFRKYVAELTGQKDTWFTSPQEVQVDDAGNFNRATVRIGGELSFECPKGTAVHQEIRKENGELVIASDRTSMVRSGNVHYEFHISVRGWERGNYYVYLHNGSQQLAKYDFSI